MLCRLEEHPQQTPIRYHGSRNCERLLWLGTQCHRLGRIGGLLQLGHRFHFRLRVVQTLQLPGRLCTFQIVRTTHVNTIEENLGHRRPVRGTDHVISLLRVLGKIDFSIGPPFLCKQRFRLGTKPTAVGREHNDLNYFFFCGGGSQGHTAPFHVTRKAHYLWPTTQTQKYKYCTEVDNEPAIEHSRRSICMRLRKCNVRCNLAEASISIGLQSSDMYCLGRSAVFGGVQVAMVVGRIQLGSCKLLTNTERRSLFLQSRRGYNQVAHW
mmetsp:Transcript_38957/g.69725  ORF Transcript_38957/g.69725 Transcript_38957/m.69725 type:complete len:267 (-) Transcript_38957:171-971(-)